MNFYFKYNNLKNNCNEKKIEICVKKYGCYFNFDLCSLAVRLFLNAEELVSVLKKLGKINRRKGGQG